MGLGPLVGIIKAAAANIPWAKVAQSTPLIVDVLGKAKAKLKLQEATQKELEERLKAVQDENARLTTALLHMSDKVQKLNSRVSLLTVISGISLLCAISALVLWMLK